MLGANSAVQSVIFYPMPARQQPPDKPVHPLRQWRDQQGLSQTQLAGLARTTQGMIGHIERYIRVPRTDLLERLVNCTGLPVEAFVLPERFLREQPNFLRKYGPRRKK
jgi:transcriptional regulator with XRE-family HTH domain